MTLCRLIFGGLHAFEDSVSQVLGHFAPDAARFGNAISDFFGAFRSHPEQRMNAPGGPGPATEYGSAESFKQIEESREALQNLQAAKLDQQISLQQQTVDELKGIGKQVGKTIGLTVIDSLF